MAQTENRDFKLNAPNLVTQTTTPGYYAIATYNLRRTTAADINEHAWTFRRPLVKDMILKYSFDIFGVQEPIGDQIANLVTDLPAYSKFGVSDHNDVAYQHQDIFYKTAKFTLLAQGKFWMAPGAPTSLPTDTTPWDSYYHACVCTWGKFQDKTTGNAFFVFNTHFDPGDPNGGTATGVTARLESAKLMLSKAQSISGGLPCIVMGDFNSNQNVVNGPYAYLQSSTYLDESWEVAPTKTPAGYRQTGNWWNPTIQGQSQIDQIFVTVDPHNSWSVLSHNVLWDNYDTGGYTNVMPSDHNPVMVEMKIPIPATPLADGKYKIVAEHSQMALMVQGASTADSAPVVQGNYTADATTNDEWNFTKIGTSGLYKIINVKSGKAMNVQGHSTADLAAIIQWPYLPTDGLYNDEWFLIDVGNGYYRIVNRGSGYGLNVSGASMTAGATVVQYHYSAATQAAQNMHFKMTLLP